MSWFFLAGIAAGFALLAGRFLVRKQGQLAAANAAGLVPVRDLTHLPTALQHSALWTLSDGGFERRVIHGVITRATDDIDVTAFDLETLRERRGEWAWLPVEPPFRIAPVVSVCVCELDRSFPHYVLKRAGRGDLLADDDAVERASHVAKVARDGLGLARSYAAELPRTLEAAPLAVDLPPEWRAYGQAAAPLAELLHGGLAAALERAGRRDLVVELIEHLVIVYIATRGGGDEDAFADLTETALGIVDGFPPVPRLSPRGVEATTTP